jgi:hypothetical protein
MQSAIEGECEPIFWQGIEVGHFRKIDNRLRIEMLRAKCLKPFKTPRLKDRYQHRCDGTDEPITTVIIATVKAVSDRLDSR